jgi:glutamate/tyrosine decarboxylase-like PLP-dependent enzyme
MPRTHSTTPLDNFKVSTQWSRRMNSLKLWLTLQVHGRQAYEELMHHQLELASGFAEWARKSEHFELAAPQVLPIVNLRVKLPGASEEQVRAANEAVVHEATCDGRRWISTTFVNGRSVIRVMVISYLTEKRHLDELQDVLVKSVQHSALEHR